MSRQRDEELLESGDYVRDPIHGVVPKDPETALRLRREKAARDAEETAKERTEGVERAEDKAKAPVPGQPLTQGFASLTAKDNPQP